jgi:DNA-binding LacI/PurR family transcriptional regulator
VDAREAGYREALHAAGARYLTELVRRLDPVDGAAVGALLTEKPEAIVCANDWTAARLMRTLLELGHAVPEEVRLVGIDDVDYASVLPVPLTTLRQPTRQIGAAALAAMLDRVRGAELPTRDILLHGTLIVRRSCGAAEPRPRES